MKLYQCKLCKERKPICLMYTEEVYQECAEGKLNIDPNEMIDYD